MRSSPWRHAFVAPAILLLAWSVPVAAATTVDLGPACEAALADLPAVAAEPVAPAWPHHDPLLDAMVPDVIDGAAQWHLLLTGTDPADPDLTAHQLATAAGRAPTDVRVVSALPEGQPQTVTAYRIAGATAQATLDALLGTRFVGFDEEPADITCTVTDTDGQPAFRASSWAQGLLALPFEDAWLVVTSFDPDRLTALEPELRAHLVALAEVGVEPAPEQAPEIGTRIAPPASAAQLAQALPDEVDGVPVAYLGESPGQLGRGMVPSRFIAVLDPITLAVAKQLEVDLSTAWGDMSLGTASSDQPGAILTVLADPTGDGARWIEPYRNVRLDRKTWTPDPKAPRLFPKGYFRSRTIGGKEVLAGASDDGSRMVLYASGPWFFLVTASDAAHAAKLLASLP